MPSEKVVKNILRWETDSASARETIAAAKRIEEQQLDVARANEVLAKTAEEAGVSQKSLAQAAGMQAKGGDSDIVGRADTAASALATLAGSMDFAGAEALGVVGDVLGLVDAWNMMKGAALANQGATTAATGGIAGMTAALTPVLAILAPIAGAAALVAGALAIAENAYEDNRRAAEVAANAIVKYNEAIAEGTTDEIARQLEQANRDLETATKTRDDLLAAQAEAWAEETGYVLGDLGARVRTALGQSVQGAEKYNDLIADQEKAILEAESAVRGLTDALGSAEVAANDASVATQKFFVDTFERIGEYVSEVTEEQREMLDAVIDAAQQSADVEIERARILKTASQEVIDAAIEEEQLRIGALERELEALRKLPQGSEEVQAALAETRGELADATSQLEFLQGAATDAAVANDQLARAEQRLSEVARETDQALAQIERSEEKVGQIRERMVDIDARAAEQRIAVNENLAKTLMGIERGIAKDRQDHIKKLASIDQSYSTVMAKLAKDAADAAADFAQFDAKQQRENLKDEKSALLDIARVREDFRREQRRAEEDQAYSLREAALARDIDRIISLQREFATESQRRAEDAEQEVSDIAAARAERAEELAYERQAERQAFNERMADIQAQAQAEAQQRAQAIAEEQAAYAERQQLRQQEIAEAKAAAQERLNAIEMQRQQERAALQTQIDEELELRQAAIEQIAKLEAERAKIASGDIADIILSEERLNAERRRAVQDLLRETQNFQSAGYQNLQNIAISFGNITTNVVANIERALSSTVGQVLGQVSTGLSSAMSNISYQLGVSRVRQ